MQETLVRFLVWEDPLEKGKATHSSILFLDFPFGSASKESTCNEGDLGSIPGLGRSPGEGKGYPLQYSGLGKSMDCIVHGVAKSRTWLSNLKKKSWYQYFFQKWFFITYLCVSFAPVKNKDVHSICPLTFCLHALSSFCSHFISECWFSNAKPRLSFLRAFLPKVLLIGGNASGNDEHLSGSCLRALNYVHI